MLTRARALQDITLRLSEVLVELHGPLTRRPTLAGPVAARLESATRELASDIAAVDEVHRRATGQRPA